MVAPKPQRMIERVEAAPQRKRKMFRAVKVQWDRKEMTAVHTPHGYSCARYCFHVIASEWFLADADITVSTSGAAGTLVGVMCHMTCLNDFICTQESPAELCRIQG